MSKIHELIEKFCPDGVSTLHLDEIFEIRGGFTPSKSNVDFWKDGTVPWFRMEDIRKNGRVLNSALQNVSEKALKGAGAFPANSIIVSTSATIGEHALVTVPFLANQRFTVLTIKSGYVERLLPKFAFYLGFSLSYYCTQNTVKSGFAGVEMVAFRSFPIPIPPLEVQREIVSILDKFTQLEAQLEAELEARRSQYEHTRDQLLDFSGDLSSHLLGELIAELCPEEVPKRTVSDLFAYEQPTPYLVSSSNYGASGCPVLTAGQTFLLGYTLETDGIFQASENRPVIIFDDFTTAFKWVDFPFKAKSSAMKMIQASSGSSIELRFLFYLMGVLNYIPGQHARQWISVFSNFEIPWPPLQVQREIVSILDKLDALVNDLSFGLPAEIAARRKQYEHYRNKLLAFKELETA